ncbi:hypothetical protein [Sphingomonas koreensis]|nr:hypothetical protein [Sphingomonas koreensis]MDC7808548.1 hypothetical protein [Sphingomonas koreensis]
MTASLRRDRTGTAADAGRGLPGEGRIASRLLEAAPALDSTLFQRR